MSEAAPGSGGTLYVVATPIGNLGDITLRALEVLRTVAVVAAEDTRVTHRLWSRYDIETPLTSYHAHSDDRRTAELLARLATGDDVALVTDAGTPLVSDPGAVLVERWIGQGGVVVPVPGASAVLAALVVSGLPAARWGFEGFLPRKGRERKERLARIAADDRATVLYEAHGRTAATLRDLADACGGERRAVVARELTKLHEEVRRGDLAGLAEEAAARPVKGEVVIVIAGATADDVALISLEAGRAHVERLVAEGVKRSKAAALVAEETGLPRRELFATDS
ncbi:MAG: 16S rRNA (cytidine(1402)-2'-O)-methyltransferase [Candidatus Limnocylindrales bacterium]